MSHQQGEAAASQAAWDDLQNDPIFFRRGYNVNMNRFWHGPQVAAIYAANFSKFRFAYTFMALETDNLAASHSSKLLFQNDSAKSGTTGEATSMDERALRGKTNALACSVIFLSDLSRLWKLRTVLVSSQPVQDWFRLHNKQCRSILENAEWLRRQLSGEFMAHIVQVFARLSCRRSGWRSRRGALIFTSPPVASMRLFKVTLGGR